MRLTGGQALVQALANEGVEALFGLPGVQLDYAFDALYEARDRIRVVHTRHEQTAAYMADGYARTSGTVGVCMVVPGPGVLNAGAGLATAYACSSPVLCIAGLVDSRAVGRGYGVLHEIEHQEAVLGSVTQWSGRAEHVADIPSLVYEAFRRLHTGRRRPVALEIPPDILQCADEVSPLGQAPRERAPGDPSLLREAARVLHDAERPVIYSGGGTLAAGAWTELRELAELLEAPVVMSIDGRGALSDRHDLAHTGVSGEALIQTADTVLAVGTRFWQPARVWGLAAGARVIRIDAEPAEIARHGTPSIGIVADAQRALAALRDELHGMRKRESRREQLRALKDAADTRLREFHVEYAMCRAIRAALPDDAIVVNDLTHMTFFATIALPVYEPRTFIGPGYQGTLGSAFPTALGAAVANPERVVVALAGDGGFPYALGDMASLRQHGLNVISIVFNNGGYGNVRRTQQQVFDGRFIACDLVNPDFVALADAFGIDGVRVSHPAELESALRSAVAADAPALIEVTLGQVSDVWSLVGRAGGLYPVLIGP